MSVMLQMGPSRSIRDCYIWRSGDCNDRYLCCLVQIEVMCFGGSFANNLPFKFQRTCASICHTLSAPCHEDVRASVHVHKATCIIRLSVRNASQSRHLTIYSHWIRHDRDPRQVCMRLRREKFLSLIESNQHRRSHYQAFYFRNCQDIDELYTSFKSLNSSTEVSTRLLFHRVLNRNKQP
jgi:hypothetical protein